MVRSGGCEPRIDVIVKKMQEKKVWGSGRWGGGRG